MFTDITKGLDDGLVLASRRWNQLHIIKLHVLDIIEIFHLNLNPIDLLLDSVQLFLILEYGLLSFDEFRTALLELSL